MAASQTSLFSRCGLWAASATISWAAPPMPSATSRDGRRKGTSSAPTNPLGSTPMGPGVVSMSTSEATRSGWSSAKRRPTTPPIEWPSSSQRSIPMGVEEAQQVLLELCEVTGRPVAGVGAVTVAPLIQDHRVAEFAELRKHVAEVVPRPREAVDQHQEGALPASRLLVGHLDVADPKPLRVHGQSLACLFVLRIWSAAPGLGLGLLSPPESPRGSPRPVSAIKTNSQPA